MAIRLLLLFILGGCVLLSLRPFFTSTTAAKQLRVQERKQQRRDLDQTRKLAKYDSPAQSTKLINTTLLADTNNSTLRSNEIKPRPTKDSIVIIVMSARGHFAQRQVIRKTWAKGLTNIYFVLGQACPYSPMQRTDKLSCEAKTSGDTWFSAASAIQESVDENYVQSLRQEAHELASEQERHGDLILTSLSESYTSLPNKLKEGYAFVIKRCKNVEWIVKADDDFYVRYEPLAVFLNDRDSSAATVFGKLKYDEGVHRKGKWAEFDYTKRRYPTFAIGSAGHAVSRPVASYVSRYKDKLFEYQGEDTSLGIWLDGSGMEVDWIDTHKEMNNDGNCLDETRFITGHRLDQEHLRQCHQADRGIDWFGYNFG